MMIDYNEWAKNDLIKEIKKLEDRKKYGLIWDEEKTKEVFEEEKEKKLPVLEDVTKNGITDTSKPNNILIEGDNYHALSVLNYTHRNKIDVIYIDPPYNTGNDDFKYNDKWIDFEDSYKHSKWLSFMEKRLRLAKPLLAKHGVIFISIDDNEYAHLKILCDEIFGEDNFIATIIWQSKTGSSDAKTIDTLTEYVLVYTKIKKNSTFLKNIGAHRIGRFSHKDKHLKERGLYYPDTLDRGGLRYSDSLNFGIKCPDGKITYPNGRTEFVNDGWTWKWGKEKVDWGIKNDFILFKKSKTKKSSWTVSYKNYLLVDNEGNQIERSLPYKNVITDIKTGDGARKIKELFGKHVFKYTKPVEFLPKLLKMVKIPTNGIILDFMAGTGTSGESVLDFNSKENTSYQFILCTNNENNICIDICYPRLNKVISGYSFEGTKKTELYKKKLSITNLKKIETILKEIEDIKSDDDEYDDFELKSEDGFLNLYGIKNISRTMKGLGGNLKYFKTSFVDSAPTDQNKKTMVERSTEILCLREDCFELVKRHKQFKIFKNCNDKYLGIIYDGPGVIPFKKVVLKLNKKFIVYMFSFNNQVNEEEFHDIQSLITIKPIPDDILNVYRRIFPYVQTTFISREMHS